MIARAAATDSRNPSEPTRSGSTTRSSATASASTRTRAIGRPTVTVTAAMAAITAALDTEGSKRVIRANIPTTASTSASRGHRRSRRPIGATSESTKATFSPDTASRCVSPAPRKSSTRVAGCARSSPTTRPVSNDRSVGPSDSAPSESARRSRLAKAATAPGGPPGSIRSARRRAATCRTTSQGAAPLTGTSCPRTRTCSPASRSASAAAVDADASSSTRRRPRRTSARRPPTDGCGSDSNVTSAVTGPADTPCSPSRARWPSELVSSATPTHRTIGCRTRNATPTVPAANQRGVGPGWSAPSTAATATAIAQRSDMPGLRP